MRYIYTIIAYLGLSLASCKQTRDNNPKAQDTPKALEDKSSVEIVSKRAYGDLVESIYSEMVDNSPELKDIENKISNLHDAKSDSLASFNKYDEKNQQFYTSAKEHLPQIQDSLLRLQLKSLIDKSLNNYNSSIERNSELLKTVNEKAKNLNDIHFTLKLTRTLPVIEEFQKKNLPPTKPVENLIDNYNRIINQTESLTKKQNGS